jgi:hypothetical protein
VRGLPESVGRSIDAVIRRFRATDRELRTHRLS